MWFATQTERPRMKGRKLIQAVWQDSGISKTRSKTAGYWSRRSHLGAVHNYGTIFEHKGCGSRLKPERPSMTRAKQFQAVLHDSGISKTRSKTAGYWSRRSHLGAVHNSGITFEHHGCASRLKPERPSMTRAKQFQAVLHDSGITKTRSKTAGYWS